VQLVAWKTGHLLQYKPSVDNITALIVGTAFNAQTSPSSARAIVMAYMKPTAINYAMCENLIAMNVGKAAKIHSCWYEEVTRVDAAQGNSDPPCAYVAVVNISSQ